MLKIVIIIAVGIAQISFFVSSQTDANLEVNNQRYCFRFTWPGPQFDADGPIMNATCTDLLNGVSGIPCHHPLAVTNNSNVPDTRAIWEEHRNDPTRIACRLTRGDVCVKYTYYFNQAVQNISYFCTKVNIEDVGAATSGCYTELRNGREIEVCICESRPGQPPCNDATKKIPHAVGLFVAGFVIVLQQWAPI
uniref:Secreted protein n=1 Tax=Lutzomyia longipalpis TaxID=7200 RepID=A0A1B0EUS2_LUTLO